MFSSPEDATRLLSECFDAEATAVFARLLRPHLGFSLADASLTVGASRLGGTPDLPVDLAWPIRDVPRDLDEIAGFGGSNHSAHIRKHLAQALPYTFIAQIDLAEAADVLPSALPDDGRLLFFCDLPAVPWRDGIESCRVIWDRSAAHALMPAEMPSILQKLAEESLEELRVEFAKHGLTADTFSHPYAGPERPMRIVKRYAIPDAHAPEAQGDPAFVAIMDDEDIADAYSDFVSENTHDRAERVERHRILGYPTPEQDDPRYAAVALLDYGRTRHWDWPERPDMAEIDAKMTAWHLLLQCDLSDFHQDSLCEGTLYFLLRDDDLHARRFERTVVVYQQT